MPRNFRFNGGRRAKHATNLRLTLVENLTAPTALSVFLIKSSRRRTLPSININLRETNPDGSPGAFNVRALHSHQRFLQHSRWFTQQVN
jgi:hypothetical protein